jgi:hypothetical protein
MKKIFSIFLFFGTSSLFSEITQMHGNLWFEPTSGAIDGSTIEITYDEVGFYDTAEMYNDGFRTAEGEFAIKMFHYGSGWGIFDVTPRPDSYEIVENNGSIIGGKSYFIYSADGKYSTIIAKWNEIPETLTYECDDYCLASKLESEVGICEKVLTYAKSPKTGTWFPFPTLCDVPENWETSSEKPSDFNLNEIGIPEEIEITLENSEVFSAGFKAGVESSDWTENDISEIGTGWTLHGTTNKITNLNIFNSADIVWVFADGNWKGWSGDEVKQALLERDYNLLESVPKNSGFWIYKTENINLPITK